MQFFCNLMPIKFELLEQKLLNLEMMIRLAFGFDY